MIQLGHSCSFNYPGEKPPGPEDRKTPGNCPFFVSFSCAGTFFLWVLLPFFYFSEDHPLIDYIYVDHIAQSLMDSVLGVGPAKASITEKVSKGTAEAAEKGGVRFLEPDCKEVNKKPAD